jgi:hypothetical protein
MSIQAYRFWEPVLELRPFRGFPESIAKTIRDRVISFKLEDDKKFLDKVTLELDNGDGALLALESLAYGVTFKMFFGYPGAFSPPRLMQCRKIIGAARVGGLGKLSGPNTAAGGIVQMELKSQIWNMNLHRALSFIDSEKDRSLILEKTTIPNAVRTIARRYGFDGPSLFVEDLPYEPIIEKGSIPSKFSFAEWVLDQARRRHWVFRINSDGFHFHSDEFEPQFGNTYMEDLTWFSGDPDVISWEITSDLNVPQDVEVRLSDARKEAAFAQLLATKASGATTTVTAILQLNTKDGVSGLSPNLMLSGSNRKSVVEQFVSQMSRAANAWKLKMRLVGNPKVCAGRKLNLRNFGPLVDGVWTTTKATHDIRPNQVYITEIDARRKGNDLAAGKIKAFFWQAMVANKAGKEIVITGTGTTSDTNAISN